MMYSSWEDAKIETRKDYIKSVLLSLDHFKEKGHLLQVVTIPPKTKQRLHFHKVQTEVYYILEGVCFINIEDKNILAKPGDSFIVDPNEKHYLWNKTDKDFKLLVFKINLPENAEEDSVWLED